MSYNNEELEEEQGFRMNLDEEGYGEEDPLVEPLEETSSDFEDDDPDNKYH